jgi:Phage terminase, small subunit
VREEIFCKEYIADFNGTRAAKAAKYSKKTAYAIANRLLKRVEVQRRIEELKEQATRKAGVTLKRVLEELGTLAFSNISDYLEFGPDGVSIRESVKMSREVLACVAEVSEVTTNQGKRVKLKLHDKAKALDSLKQYFIDSNTGEDEKKVIRLPLRAPQKMQK